jgi:DNA polymerase III alpha subunit
MNMAEPAPFYQACKELLGEEYCYPMIAFGKVQEKTGWKIYAATNGVSVEKANAVSKAIDEYMVAKKYADEDAEIDIEDYIPEEHMENFNNSKKFRSVIETIKQHACGYLVSPINIIKEIGLIRCKDVVCAGIEGSMADKLGYVKNDFLVVSCVDIIDKIYKRIGIPQPSPQELLKLVDDKVWDVYELGLTFEVNQFTANRTKKYMEIYKPRSIEDLSSAVA